MNNTDQTALATEYLVKLLQFPSIGKRTATKLVANLNSVVTSDQDLLNFLESQRDIIKMKPFPANVSTAAIDKGNRILEESEKNGIKLLCRFESTFPASLKGLKDCPLILNYIGEIDVLSTIPSIAIIGTRKPTAFGEKAAFRFGQVFAENGQNVVSGLAIGCDSAAHKGALAGSGTTTAVLAHGLDTVYPKQNKYLANTILDGGGLLLSEYFIGQKPLNNFFVERNRIQAGLSICTLVVETERSGGTMHTANYCIEYSRILSCFNHPAKFLSDPKTEGNQHLIKEKGAYPLQTSEDILNLLDLMAEVNSFPSDTTEGDVSSEDSSPQTSLFRD